MATAEITDERAIELARANVDRGADRIERVYGWEVERRLAGVRAALTLAGSIVGLIVAAVFKEAGQAGFRQILIGVAGLAGSFGSAAYHHARLRRMYGNYLESLQLFAVVQQIQEAGRWILSRSP